MARPTKVLLVDDDHGVRRSLARLLLACGYAVSEAGTVAEAIAMLDDDDHDVAVVDLHLPDGSGTQVTAAIREQGRPTRTALFTGRPTPGLAACADAVFRQPHGVGAILTWIGGGSDDA